MKKAFFGFIFLISFIFMSFIQGAVAQGAKEYNLIGRWVFVTRVLGVVMTDKITLSRAKRLNDGTYHVYGIDQDDEIAVGTYIPGVQKYVIISGTTVRSAYIFTMTKNGNASGCFHFIYQDDVYSKCFPLVGQRIQLDTGN